ncbi:hypothetical protein [Serratia sp. BIGb0163]|uniref:hypothetical protein n=1 Tax=Serratia sp. BIGb0163 TaxID=2940613 RepID=UPI002166E3FE|nr:hypothetical protein [Serratia sp. BIGb0163]MCS4265146.1 hypothetical protein [Serratia sp. BIGb0163]
MKSEVVQDFVRPILGVNISRTLGVRHRIESVDAAGNNYDIVTDDNGMINDLRQGLSVCPPPKENMAPHLLRLKKTEYVFFINEDFLAISEHLEYIEDTVQPGQVAKHGIIAPRYKMHINDYISYLSATRGFWEVLHDEISDEIGTKDAFRRQLDAESKGVYFRANL